MIVLKKKMYISSFRCNSETFHMDPNRMFMGSVPIGVLKYQESVLGIEVLVVHVLHNTGGTALVVIWNCLADQI